MSAIVKVPYANSNRIGKVNILYEVLRDEPEMIGALQALLLPIIESFDHASGRGKTYIAASKLFHELQENDEIPEYRIEFVYDQHFENPEREAARINSGRFGFVAIRNHIVRAPLLNIAARASHPSLH